MSAVDLKLPDIGMKINSNGLVKYDNGTRAEGLIKGVTSPEVFSSILKAVEVVGDALNVDFGAVKNVRGTIQTGLNAMELPKTVGRTFKTATDIVGAFTAKETSVFEKIKKIFISTLKTAHSYVKSILFLVKQNIVKVPESCQFIFGLTKKVLDFVLSVFKIVSDVKDIKKGDDFILALECDDTDTAELELCKEYVVKKKIGNFIKIAAAVTTISLAVIGVIGMFISAVPSALIGVLTVTAVVLYTSSAIYTHIMKPVAARFLTDLEALKCNS